MVGNLSTLSVRQFSQGIVDMAHDSTGLTDHLLYRLLYTPKLLNSHAHKQALPAYFDVSRSAMRTAIHVTFAHSLFCSFLR